MTGRVLLLSPSRGLGGGIERYVATVEWAFAAEGVECRRLDLSGSGARAHVRLLAQGRAILGQTLDPPAWSSRTGRCCRWRRCWPGIPPYTECQLCVMAAMSGVRGGVPEGSWSAT